MPKSFSEFKGKYIYQVSLSLLFKIFGVFFSFFVTKVTLNKLGVEDYSLWATLLSLLTMAAFLNFGMSGVIQNTVAKREIFWQKKLYNQLILTVLISIVVLFFSIFVGSLVYDSIIIVSIFSLSLSVIIIQSSVVRIYVAMRSSQVSEFIPLITNVIFITILMLFFEEGAKIENVLISYLFVKIVVLLVSTINLIKMKLFPHGSFVVEWYLLRSNIKSGSKFFLAQLVTFFLYQSQPVLVYNLLSSNDVVTYDLFNKFSIPLLMFSVVMFKPLWTKFNESDEATAKNALRKVNKLLILMLPLGVGFSLLIPSLTSLFFDITHDEGRVISFVRVLAIYLQVISTPYSYYLNSRNILNEQVWINAVSASAFILICYLFKDSLSLIGLIFYSLIAYVPFCVFSISKTYKSINKI